MRDWITLILLLVTVALSSVGVSRTYANYQLLQEVKTVNPTVKHMRWMSGGVNQEIIVTKTPEEEAGGEQGTAEFVARCRAELDAQLLLFPKDS